MRRLRRAARPALATGVALGCLALLGTACSTSGPGDTAGGSRRLALASSLVGFNACDDLLASLREEGMARVTPYGLPGMGGYAVRGAVSDVATGATVAATAAKDSAAVPSGEAASTPAYSTTNTVEAGIDEGDLVQTDGTHLFLVSGNRLLVVSATGGTPTLVGSLTLPGTATRLVRVGTTLLLDGRPDATVQDGASRQTGAAMPAVDGPVYDNRSALWQVDVSRPDAPRLVRQLAFDGTVLSIRMTDDVARVVVRGTPPGLGFVSPNGPGSEQRALETNKAVIAGSSIEDWTGGYALLDGKGGAIGKGRLADCKAVSRPASFHGFATTTVLSIDLTKGLGEPNGATVLADGQQVYASAKNLYVAIGAWQDTIVPIGMSGTAEAAAPEEGTTAIHRFTFDGNRADYTATGTVTGSLLNDFSLSERDDVLRVATTAGSPWSAGDASESFVTTLVAKGDELVTLGRVGELGRGERIQGVRFLGSTAYVVTFRQTDPLYVVDLRNPAQPAVTGELKMNGYSGYLHPIGDDRLLGVGRDADANGRTTGALVSVFDVSDPTAPTRTASYTLPDAWLNTEWDHQSFLWWGPERLALLAGNFDTGATIGLGGILGLDVGTSTITERGRIVSTPGTAECPSVVPSGAPTTKTADGLPPVCVAYQPPFTRAVVVGDHVFAISDTAVQAAALKTLATEGRLALS